MVEIQVSFLLFFLYFIHSALFPTAQVTQQPGHLFWPPGSALTARLRRLVTAYQRSYKREQMKIEAAERGDRRRRRCEAAFKLKEIARREKQQRCVELGSRLSSKVVVRCRPCIRRVGKDLLEIPKSRIILSAFIST